LKTTGDATTGSRQEPQCATGAESAARDSAKTQFEILVDGKQRAWPSRITTLAGRLKHADPSKDWSKIKRLDRDVL
jgi:hypothetical protein